MNANGELDTWRSLWQAQVEAPSVTDLRDRVTRESRRNRILMIPPIVVTVTIGGWIASRAIISAQWEDVVLAVETWLFIAVVWIGTLWIGRGTWGPLADTTSGFIDLSIHRCRSAIAGLRFGAVVYLAQLAFIIYWKLRYASVAPETLLASWPVVVIGWLGVPMFLGGGLWFSRRKQAELRALLELRRQLIE